MLNQKTLENFNKIQKRTVSLDKNPKVDDETVPMVDRNDYENDQLKANNKPPKPLHKDHGKIPKYLAKYKDEA